MSRSWARVRTDFNARQVRKAVSQAASAPGGPLMRMGLAVEREAKLSMRAGGRVAGRKRGIPSAPGEPPHVQTGHLRSSITTAVTSRGTVIVGPTRTAWHGKLHELGGEFGGRHFPRRAFMGPALMRVRGKASKHYKDLPLASTPAGRELNRRKYKKRG